MQAIQKCSVCSHFRRERIKQARGFQQYIYALVDVAHKDHRGRGCLFLFATGKGTGSHIVLHDLDAVFILELDSGNLIKSHTVPKTNQANRFAPHIVEQVCNGRLSTRNQNAVGRDFFIKMRFSRTAGTKFTEVEIVLHQWNHSCEQEPFFSFRKFVRFHADRTQKDIQPLILCKSFTATL